MSFIHNRTINFRVLSWIFSDGELFEPRTPFCFAFLLQIIKNISAQLLFALCTVYVSARSVRTKKPDSRFFRSKVSLQPSKLVVHRTDVKWKKGPNATRAETLSTTREKHEKTFFLAKTPKPELIRVFHIRD